VDNNFYKRAIPKNGDFLGIAAMGWKEKKDFRHRRTTGLS
jgi:hypothetical protein